MNILYRINFNNLIIISFFCHTCSRELMQNPFSLKYFSVIAIRPFKFSVRRNDGEEQVLNSLVVVHDLTLDAVHLRCLLADFLLQFGELVLQWLQYFFGDFLLLDELLLARHALLLPVVVLLAHGVDVIGHEVDTLAERVRALAKNLDGLLHELNVLLCEGTCHARGLFDRFVWIGSSGGLGR